MIGLRTLLRQEDAACVIGENCSGDRLLQVKLRRKTNTDPEKKEWLILPLVRQKGAAALDGTVESEDSAAPMTSLTETLDQLSDADAPAPIQPFGGGVGAATHVSSTTRQGAASLSYGTTLVTKGRQSSANLDGAPLSPQSRLGRSGSVNGRQRSGGGTALSRASLLFAACVQASLSESSSPIFDAARRVANAWATAAGIDARWNDRGKSGNTEDFN